MTDPSSASRGAEQALEAVRPAVERLSSSRSSQNNASDLAAICAGVESALGVLLGRADLSGQALVREARQRDAMSLEQAHAALELFAVRERVGASGPVDVADLDVAREAYASLAGGFGATPAGAGVAAPAGAAVSGAGPAAVAAGPPAAVPSGIPLGTPSEPLVPAADAPHDRPPHPGPIVLVLVVVLIALVGLYYAFGRRPDSALDAGIAAYTAGHRDSAMASFARAVRTHPQDAQPHLYLARMARENGDYTTAGKELRTAVQLDPTGVAGQRELGAFFLSRGGSFSSESRPELAAQDYDAARRAYVRAIQADAADVASEGYLACVLARLGRADEAATWLKRAGPGPWTPCASAPAAPPPRTAP